MKRIMVILLLILSIITISGCIGSNDSEKQTGTCVIVSDTMAPALHRGDIVFIENNPSSIQVGDIIVYNATWFNKPVIHRVIAIKNDSNGKVLYELKGDNNPSPDPVPVNKEQIISKVVNDNNGPSKIPKIGYITLWIRGL